MSTCVCIYICITKSLFCTAEIYNIVNQIYVNKISVKIEGNNALIPNFSPSPNPFCAKL